MGPTWKRYGGGVQKWLQGLQRFFNYLMMKNCKHDFVRLARRDSDVQNIFFRARNFCRSFRIKKRRLPFSSRNVDVDVKNVGPTLAISNAETRLDEQGIELATFWNSDLTRLARVLVQILERNNVNICLQVFFFLMLALLRRASFLTTISGLYFSHHYTCIDRCPHFYP